MKKISVSFKVLESSAKKKKTGSQEKSPFLGGLGTRKSGAD